MVLRTYYLGSAVGLALVASSAYAQTAPEAASAPQAATGAPANADAGNAGLEEIVVTARRAQESLQDVPQTVSAVSSETLTKLTIQQFQDVQAVVPGLNLSKGLGTQSASLRGISFEQRTAAQPTVAFYLNEAPTSAGYLFNALFDVGQIEVLKGPQGTTRGTSAPSGAITLTTRKPVMDQFGGYVAGTLTNLEGRNAQAALNIPIINDKLSVRVAGLYDRVNLNVRSINNPADSYSRTYAGRVTVAFTPIDEISGQITYQHIDSRARGYQIVEGPGRGTLATPSLAARDRLSVQDGQTVNDTIYDILTGQLDTFIMGHKLSYVASYQKQKLFRKPDADIGNLLPGFALFQPNNTRSEQLTQELRIASEPGDHLFDYVIGGFYSRLQNKADIVAPHTFLPGTFGNPNVTPTDTSNYNVNYQIPLNTTLDQKVSEKSIFGTLTLHIGENTELTGGIRHIWSTSSAEYRISTLAAKSAAFLPAGICTLPAVGGTVTTSPGTCDVPRAGAVQLAPPVVPANESPTLYNISLSHHVTPDFLLYASTGTAYRPPVPTIGIQGDLAASNNTVLASLSNHPSEKSTAYEAGFKLTFLDKRARLNASVFRQKFKNLTIYRPGISYLNRTSPAPTGADTNFDFTATVDAIVKGFDIDAALQVTRNWNISAQGSYADSKVSGSQVPCNTPNATPRYNTDGLISLCPGGPASRLPLWNATFQSELTQPINDNADGFVRGLVNYFPTNRNRVQDNFTVPSYTLVNFYAGVRSSNGAWEVSAFLRNAFDTKRKLDLQPNQPNIDNNFKPVFSNLSIPAGYLAAEYTPPREFGLTVRYAFGSR